MNLTLGTTFYNNPEYLLKFVEKNIDFVDELIIVDDGSPTPITDYLSPTKKLRLFKVAKDYGFNSHGCRNLIMSKTTNDWVVLLDLDRKFDEPEYAYNVFRTRKLHEKTLYRFLANTVWYNQNHHISVNDFLINKNHFFSAGGYDEEIIGQRWGDREYFKQLLHFGNEKTLIDVLMWLTRKPSIALNEDSPNDKKRNIKHNKLIKKRIEKPEPNKPILTFEWKEIK